ncbi:MAG: mechanosensitive ion channel [Gammaproteobacteria bacterium]|nr:mechanosensitive ion channel [Gammaproteobacteria bacterium]
MSISMRLQLRVLVRAFIVLASLWSAGAASAGAAVSAEPAADGARIDALVETLEDPAAREQLIAQLRLLRAAQAPAPQAAPVAARSAVADLLQAVAQRLGRLTDGVMVVAGMVDALPDLYAWMHEQATDPQRRGIWVEVLSSLLLVLGAAYGSAYAVRIALRRPRRSVAERVSAGLLLRLAALAVRWIVDMVPVLVLAAVAYLVLSVIETRPNTRLVALAWVNAGIIVWTVLALARVVVAPTAPRLRLLPLGDESANYVDIWVRRLALTSVYGYFALQAGLFLGLTVGIYLALLRLLGLFITALLVVLILQNRAAVATRIRATHVSGDDARMGLRLLRRRLAASWHVIAIVYVVVLYAVWALDLPGGFAYVLRASLLSVLVLLLARGAVHLLDAGFERGFHISEDLHARFPRLEARANRYLAGLRTVAKAAVGIIGLLALLQAWGIDTFAWATSTPGRALGGTAFTLAGVIFGAVLVWEVASNVIEGYLDGGADGAALPSARARTLLDVARNALMVILSVLTTLMVLAELGVDIAPLLAGAGVVGLAVGFGAQTLVKDVITGAFILIENLFEVGDVIQVGDKAGVVESVTIRRVRLRDLAGTVHTIPFSAITTVSNLTRDFAFYVFDVGVAYREDVDAVIDTLVELGAQLQTDPEFAPLILAPLEILGVDAFADSAVIIKARFKTLPIKQWAVGREFNRRMKRRFDELGIEIPFPHRTIYLGVDKQGRAPALNLRGAAPESS